MNGQISLFDYMPIRSPCGRPCMYEWGSLRCFEARGQIRDKVRREWVKDETGKPIIRNDRECDYEPG